MILTLVSGGKIGMSADQQTAAVVTIGVACNIVTWVFKTFFTSTVHAASLPAAPAAGASTTLKVIAFFAIMLLSLAFAPSTAHAQIKKPALTGNPIEDIKTDLNGGTQPAAITLTGDPKKDAVALWKKIVAASKDDISYAIKMATAANTGAPAGITTGAGMRLSCLNAIQALNQQANGLNLVGTDGKPITRPDPALFTDAETLAEVIDAVQPGGPLWTSCSGAAQLAGTNVMAFINALITGAAGLAVLSPIK